uniref:Ig-like domain-containing protein n=1 Tax=Oryzias latipes TaxID=8090 RepID=A0A3B3HTM2_ORYLA
QVGETPVLKEEIQDVTTKLGESGTLTCGIIGRPLPEIKWYRFGKELIQSRKYKMSSDGRNHSLSILTDEQEDEGMYTCGKLKDDIKVCLFLFLVPAKIHLPKELQGMGAVHAARGDNVTIKIPITGKPEPAITWQKGQEILSNSVYHQVITTRSFTSLVFQKGVQRKDSGYYTITAKNRFGMDKQTIEVNVADIPEAPKGLLVSEISRDSITLNWEPPSTQVAWYFGNRQLHPSPKYEISYNNGFASIYVKDIEESDDGIYRCKVVSDNGEDSAYGELFVETVRMSLVHSESILSIPGCAPRIEALPEDISIEPGKVLTVACAFSGDAKQITWSRGGKTIEVTPGGRFHIETTEDLTTLIITGVREEDAGAYTLKLSNELGSDTATVHISIRSG